MFVVKASAPHARGQTSIDVVFSYRRTIVLRARIDMRREKILLLATKFGLPAPTLPKRASSQTQAATLKLQPSPTISYHLCRGKFCEKPLSIRQYRQQSVPSSLALWRESLEAENASTDMPLSRLDAAQFHTNIQI